MKNLTLLFAIVIGSACAHDNHDNLAVRQMKLVDPAATCDPWFTDVGDQHVHTASCTNSARDVVYVRVEVGKPLSPPQLLLPGPAALAKAQDEAQRAKAPPTPAPPPPAAVPPHAEAQP